VRALAVDERDEIVAERKSQRAREAIIRKLSRNQQLTTGELRRSLKVDIRDYSDAALAELLDGGESRFPKEHEAKRRYTCTTGTPLKNYRVARTIFRVPRVHGYPARSMTTRRFRQSDTDRVNAHMTVYSKEATPAHDRGLCWCRSLCGPFPMEAEMGGGGVAARLECCRTA
jgi:hypothetical protein